jgi:Zn-dependent protease/predicted transcriptional regulator
MKWSLKIGRFAGIDVYLHVTFLIVVGIVGLDHWFTKGTFAAALEGTAFFLAIFLCVLLHEFGHALTAARFGIHTEDITLLPIGGIARLERIPENPLEELAVAIAGPAVNVIIAAVLFAILTAAGSQASIRDLGIVHGHFFARLMWFNIGLVLFNMIPAFPMDGGRVLRAFLALAMPHARATRIAAAIGQGIAILFAIAGFFGQSMLIIIALVVWIGASQEAGLSEMRSLLGGVPVRQAMLTDFRSLDPNDTLRDVAGLIMAGSQQDFPVMEDGQFAGVLSRKGLIEALARDGLDGRVAAAMARDCDRADADEMLEVVVPRVRGSHCPVLPVFSGGRLIGLLNMENISELMMIRSALATAQHAGAA